MVKYGLFVIVLWWADIGNSGDFYCRIWSVRSLWELALREHQVPSHNPVHMAKLAAVYPTQVDGKMEYITWEHMAAPESLFDFLLTNPCEQVRNKVF